VIHATKAVSLSFISVLCLGIGVATHSSDAFGQSVIESKIDGEFEGWEGDTVIPLINGQIWMQVEYYYHYRYAYMPDVFIYPTNSGWKMKVDGITKAVGVERLR